MRLTNPTDDELNAAFAEKVCGMDIKTPRTWKSGMPGVWHTAIPMVPRFTGCIEAVLPWLEKWGAGHGRAITIGLYCDGTGHTVEIAGGPSETGWSISRIAVIVLLRANGVEVEFTP